MADLKELHHLRRNPPRLQPCPFFRAFLLGRLTRLESSLSFLLGCRAGLGRCALDACSLRPFSRRLFASTGRFPLRVLLWHWKFLRHPFGSRPFSSCTLIGSARQSEPLGFFSGLPITFDPLRCVRPATRSGFAESQHATELLSSLTRSRTLGDSIFLLL
ncbi:hypothetical protein [Nocardia beijingensis]|uniref:Transmembrane protein n=1 Tax=Nocardia beijingensis TaxID=95162 RepID=A0ABW7WNH3_9NOCA